MGELLIDKFEVVVKLQCPIEIESPECDPILLPFYDQERFPYVITRGWWHHFFIVNTQDGTMRILTDAKHLGSPGIFIQVGERAFDFHFTSEAEEEDKKPY